MDALQPNELRPGRWRIGEWDLQDGDLIEVLLAGRWHVARYEYQWSSHEYQLKMDGKPVAIAPGTQARKYQSSAT